MLQPQQRKRQPPASTAAWVSSCGSGAPRGTADGPRTAMYLEHWESFQQQAEELFRARPLHTRYVLKFRSSDGKLVLKVTDDVQVPPLPPSPCGNKGPSRLVLTPLLLAAR